MAISLNTSISSLGASIRAEFPIFSQSNGARHFLDSAATAQKPGVVINRLVQFLSQENANINRGAYALSAHATEHYDAARAIVAKFIGAASTRSVVFTKNATEAINVVAHGSRSFVGEGDTVLVSVLEHHSNIVPWQIAGQQRRFNVAFAEIDDDATINLTKFASQVKALQPKIVAFTGLSNAFGTLTPIAELTAIAHANGARVLIDASQLVAHFPVDVTQLDVDFLVFSGHKVYGPMGIGVLYGKEEVLSKMEPFLGGGDMISSVAVSGSTWADLPRKFEAGTPPVADAIALGAALEFLQSVGFSAIRAHDEALFREAWSLLSEEKGVTLYGPATSGKAQSSILPFNVEGVHPHDVATILDSVGVQVRAGHHCAMPALHRLGIHAMARASIGIYSCSEDFVALREGIRKAKDIFG